MRDLLFLALICTLVGACIPASGDSGMGKSVAFLAALSLILAVSEPAVKALEDISALPSRITDLFLPDEATVSALESQSEEWVIRFSEENIASDVVTLVTNRFSLDTDAVQAEADTETDEKGYLRLRCVYVTVDSSAVSIVNDISQYVSNLLACPCKVTVHTKENHYIMEE